MALANIRSTVVNTSGKRMYFDCLPLHGVYLDPGQEFTYPGHVTEWFRRRSAGPAREKMIQGFDYCVDQGYLEIKNSPAPVLFDDTLGAAKELGIDNGSPVVTDPASTL